MDTSVFIRQGDKEDELKASLRSNEIVDVAEIAASFNGGGIKEQQVSHIMETNNQ